MCVCSPLFSNAEGKVQRKSVGTCFRGVKFEAEIVVVVVVVGVLAVMLVALRGLGVRGDCSCLHTDLRQTRWAARPMKEREPV